MKKFWLGFVVVFILSIILETVANTVVLMGIYAQTPALWRPQGEMKMWIFYVVYAIAAFFFTLIWHWAKRWNGIFEGLRYGICVGCLVAIPMGYGTYGAMPIPYSLALGWFLCGLVEYTLYGAALGLIYGKPKPAAA